MFFIKKVLILFGGNSTEHYVSCKSCKSIIENIDRKLFKYEVAGIDFDNTWYKFSDDLFYLEDGSWFAIRPSGTEPKCKFYYEAVDSVKENAASKPDMFQAYVLKILKLDK